jgi:hypothetical protein
MKEFNIIYKYGMSPLQKVTKLENGEKYATSNGDIVLFDGEEFKIVRESPLVPIQGNTVENLTEVQLSLYWTLLKNEKYDGDN